MGATTVQACFTALPEDAAELDNVEASQQDLALIDLAPGQNAIIERISLPSTHAHFLMRIGFFPGANVRFCRRAPLGDPSVYSVDGTEIALRAETARHVLVRLANAQAIEAEPSEFDSDGDLR